MIRTSALLLAVALPACAGAPPPQAPPAVALTKGASYPAMAPIAEYRMAVDDEVKLARSAGPPSVADHADVLVLGDKGYVAAGDKGTNGFVCIVQRSWADEFDDPQFWNPKVRSPNCFNAAAARSVLPAYLKRTEWVLAGVALPGLLERAKAAVASKEFGPPEVGAMCFMMSREGHLNDDDGHWHPHVMYFLPHNDPAEWGANLPGSPLFAVKAGVEPVTTFMSPVRKWSDGTPDAPHDH
jgi:hypothetical protein